MLKDAFEGKLIDIPPSVMPKQMVDENVWECTRLVMSDDVSTHAERSMCLGLIVQGLIDVAVDQGANSLISLSPLALMRALRQLGFGAERIGDPYLNEGDGRRYAVLSMTAERSIPTVPTATHRPQPMPLHAPAV